MALVLAFAAWTVLVWGTRVSNILGDGGGLLALVVATGLAALGVAAGVDGLTRRLPWAVPSLAAATAAVWLVRAPLVLLHDHAAAFKVVHVGLAAVSVGLAASALLASRARPRVAA